MKHAFLQKPLQQTAPSPKIQLVSASEIMMPKNGHDLALWKKNQLLFCYKIALNTIEACRNGSYHLFDAHTTTRCCHGLSLVVCELLKQAHNFDLDELYTQANRRHSELLLENDDKVHCQWLLPKPLIDLSRLYILCYASETDAQLKIRKTVSLSLKKITDLTTDFCSDLVANLQSYFSNWVANSYESYSSNLYDIEVNEMPIRRWAKYVSQDYLRVDQRGRLYAASLFSMQVILGHLIHSKSKVALINDLRCEEGNIKGRYIRLFQGDGKGKFLPLDADAVFNADWQNEPVVVFGGVAVSNNLDESSLFFKMEGWAHRFTELVLAHETSYPQFPKVNKDPNFNSHPIEPTEQDLQSLLSAYSKIRGFSLDDPSLCCLAHIYSASLKQVISCLKKPSEEVLPYSQLPKV